ncbi:hypothetical protein HZC32_03205 [Candidatus Woesearchaeota archaeon]|nr:hypothetical protein [Candidatus Woesearchaeota archaeon]
MNYLKEGLVNTLRAVKEHKRGFLWLIFLQIGVIFIVLYLAATYPMKVLQDVDAVTQLLQDTNYNATSLLSVYQQYLSMVRHITELVTWLMATLLFPQALLWIVTNQLMEKKSEPRSWKTGLRQAGKSWVKYLASVLVLLGIPTAIGYFMIKYVFTLQTEDSIIMLAKVAMILLGVIYYLLIGAFTLMGSPSWRVFVSDFWNISIRRLHQLLLVMIINGILISGIILSIYLSMTNESLFLLTWFSSLLLIAALVLTRMFLTGCVQVLRIKEYEKSHN